MRSYSVVFLLLIVLSVPGRQVFTGELLLQGSPGQIFVNPATLELRFQPAGLNLLRVSAPMPEPLEVADLKQDPTRAEWSLPASDLKVAVQLEADAFSIRFVSGKAGAFTWPRIADPSVQAWTLPLHEGAFVPADDARWIGHLEQKSPLDTTADLGLPFWGLRLADFTVSVVLTNPFNNQVSFQSAGGRLGASLKHEFTRNQAVKEYGVRFRAGGASPLEAARHYREWLVARGEFVSLADKIRLTPEAAKLPGAAHVYLWGDDAIAVGDILDWKAFARELKTRGEATGASPARRIWALLQPEAKASIDAVLAVERPDRYTKSQVVAELSRVLARADLYEEAAFQGVMLAPEALELLKRGPDKLTPAELFRWNGQLLAAAFPGLLAPPGAWGDGISPKMVRALSDAGLDRLWLGSGSWSGFLRRPETVELARKLGYLIGPYDSYHSIHRPGEPETWETAQFDGNLYETGAIVLASGKKKPGFQKKGYLLSPAAARPYVEKRVTELMDAFQANSWFIDCDGFGEFFDDYSEAHPSTQEADARARRERIAWIRDRFSAVIGSEGCSAPLASTIHFAHGVMTPSIGWGDPDLKDRKSPYFMGGYWPPGEPAAFFKPVPLKEEYRFRHFDPRFRLPLFQAVFHDSVVATHHWGSGSFKYRDEVKATQCLEVLYGVPPLWHLNPGELERRRSEMKRYYEFFSPLHRETATLPMTSFDWLTADRLVQRTTFGGRIEVVANLGSEPFERGGVAIPPASVWVRTGDGASGRLFSP